MVTRAHRVPLHTLASGARFAILDDDGSARRTGTLLYANECRARVKYDNDARHVTLPSGAEFDAPGRAIDIAANTEVVLLDHDRES